MNLDNGRIQVSYSLFRLLSKILTFSWKAIAASFCFAVGEHVSQFAQRNTLG